jgi:mannose-6-phosphate isomerase-like protein (cupin superfamily)
MTDSIGRPKPRRITNPLIDDVVTFLETTEETGGDHVLLELDLAPYGGRDNPMHIHLVQSETFRVKEGRVKVTIAGRTVELGAGDTATAPPRTPHRYFSDSPDRMRMELEVRPAGRFEDGLRIIYGLARHGRTDPHNVPRNPLELGLMVQMSEFYLASLPLWLQRIMCGALAFIGRRSGVDRRLEAYLYES